jgi:hypothetical protein
MLTTRRWLSLIALFVSGGLLAADAPALPKDVDPLPPALAKQMTELERATEKNRGLKLKHPVPCGTLGEPALKKKMIEAFEDDLPAEKMAPLEITLKTFGLIPETMDLAKYFPVLLTSQVGGFYDPKKQYLVLVQRQGGLLPKELKEKYGAALSERMEQTVLVHEMTHALQDQYFNLQKFVATNPLSDDSTARLALVEGDATLTMYNFFLRMKLENMPGFEQQINQMLKDPKQMMDMLPDAPGSKELAEAPAWFRDTLLFSYMRGYVFCLNVKRLGGQKLLDYGFTTDPPRSSEQILHPEKWHTQRDDPIAITLPDLTPALPGYKKAAEGDWGEAGIRIMLADRLKDEEKAGVAAAGWGGDRFAIYEKDGQRVLAWITEWDTEADGREFQDAAAKALGAEWKVELVSPKRVQVIRGKLAAGELAALKAKLALAEAKLPENKNIDLAKLGAAPEKDTGFDIGALLDDPAVRDMLGNLLGGSDKNELGLDFGELLNNPQVQEMVKGLLEKEQPGGQASQDGRTYSNDGLGFTINVPASQKDWKLDPKPPLPMACVQIGSPDGTVQINVASPPVQVPLEMMEMATEMGTKLAMKDFKKIKSGMFNKDGVKGYEIEYEGSQAGQKLHMLQRYYSHGECMLVVTAASAINAWKDNEKAIAETMDSFKLKAPKKAAAPAKVDEKEPLQE